MQEIIQVRMANGQATSAGAHAPGDVVGLPPDEARDLIRQGLATRVPPGPDAGEIITVAADGEGER